MMSLFLIIIFVSIEYYSFKHYKEYFPFLFMLFFSKTAAIVNCYYIEKGNYISEQFRFGYNVGATEALTILMIIFSIVLILMLKFLKHISPISNYNKHVSNNSYNLVLILICIAILLLIVNLFFTGIPLFNRSVNKFSIWKNSKFRVIEMIRFYYCIIALLLGALFDYFYKLRDKFKTRLIIAVSVVFFIYFILEGNKFTPFLYSSIYALIPFVSQYQKYINKENISKYKKKAIILATCITLLTGFLIYTKYNTMYGETLSIVKQRVLVLQGHTWWGAYEKYKIGSINKDLLLKNEVSRIFNKGSNELKYNTGMYFLMRTLAPPAVVETYFRTSATFTEAYPAINILIFGMGITIIFQIILAMIFGVLIYYINVKIVKQQMLQVGIIAAIFYNVSFFYGMGDYSTLFSLKNLIFVILLILVNIINRYVKESNL